MKAGARTRPVAVDDAVAVDVEPGADRRDRSAVDSYVDDLVDAFGRIEDARAANDEVVGAGASYDRTAAYVHATPTAVSTATGPLVSRS